MVGCEFIIQIVKKSGGVRRCKQAIKTTLHWQRVLGNLIDGSK